MTPEAMALHALGSALEQAVYITFAVIFLAYVGRGCYRAFQSALDSAAKDIR